MKTLASILAAAVLAAANSAQAAPLRYEVEPDHTFVTFEVTHFNTSTVRARFDIIKGFVELDRQAKEGRADIAIDASSISSGVPNFDKHLKSGDFFDVAKHPEARFTSTAFKFEGDALKSVEGELTLLGQTHPVTLAGKRFNCYDQPVLKAPVCGGDFEATIKRSQWGMNWGIDMGVPDDVRLLIQIEAVQQQ
ncbi:YceI family protein [Pusillimonas noertemannii]|uniref:Polyisoprenoid-binding protein YceI n=1 Tax=Pusillimonas noertemannii TaxID=305977 RepID=A0A2U1CQE7_9BURK|nr:YceI family protein [Pusillimonas noertemannii]PVY68105.1 polyisoprenoid-binding protein YceI [Pusillimonas noertemannii]